MIRAKDTTIHDARKLEIVAHLLSLGWTYEEIAKRAGVSVEKIVAIVELLKPRCIK